MMMQFPPPATAKGRGVPAQGFRPLRSDLQFRKSGIQEETTGPDSQKCPAWQCFGLILLLVSRWFARLGQPTRLRLEASMPTSGWWYLDPFLHSQFNTCEELVRLGGIRLWQQWGSTF